MLKTNLLLFLILAGTLSASAANRSVSVSTQVPPPRQPPPANTLPSVFNQAPPPRQPPPPRQAPAANPLPSVFNQVPRRRQAPAANIPPSVFNTGTQTLPLQPAGPATAVSTNGLSTTTVDGYSARVDNTIITLGEVRESILPYLQQLNRRYHGEELAKRVAQAYIDGREALIEEKLLSAEAKDLGLVLPESVVNEEINNMIRERFNNDRVRLNQALAERRMTMEEWRQEVTDQIIVRMFYSREVTQRASVSAQAVRDEYERTKQEYFIPSRVKYRFILINKGRTDNDRAVKKKQAEDILKKLRNGADFETVAKEFSEGDTGVTPWRDLRDIREEFHTALENTPVGGISDLIETRDEYYIVQVVERREEGYTPFEDVREQIKRKLLAAERERLHKDLIARLSAKHFIERY